MSLLCFGLLLSALVLVECVVYERPCSQAREFVDTTRGLCYVIHDANAPGRDAAELWCENHFSWVTMKLTSFHSEAQILWYHANVHTVLSSPDTYFGLRRLNPTVYYWSDGSPMDYYYEPKDQPPGNMEFGGVVWEDARDLCHYLDRQGNIIFWDDTRCTNSFVPNCAYHMPNCFSHPAWDYANACRGNGACYGTDSCQCDTNYGGADCFQCWGLVPEDGAVCSGYGTCVDTDDCDCDSVHSGIRCEIPICNGVLGNLPGVCSSRGTCVDGSPPTCSCTDPSSWGGADCDLPVCDGIVAGDPGACNDQGTCTGVDTCNCDDDNAWTGTYCHIPVCGGILAGAPGVCSGNGVCIGADTCICFDNWASQGGYCNDYPCEDGSWKIAASPNECSGHGTCSPTSMECVCEDNWDDRFGLYCNDYRCEDGNWAVFSGSECSGHGTCTASAPACSCWDNWENRIGYCDDYKCEDGLWNLGGTSCSGNGGCTSTNAVCNCYNNWADRVGYCDDYKCQDGSWKLQSSGLECSGHGTCSEFSSTCQCDDNWDDEGLGYCNDYRCQDGNWAIAAPAECSGHGTCSPTNAVCQCENNWDDRAGYCDDYQCQDGTWVLEAPGTECSGHGSCTEFSAVCTCQDNWNDRDGYCDDYKCEDGNWALVGGSECSGHGTCTPLSSTCSCVDNWANEGFGFCNDYKCEDLQWNFAQDACSSHGSCSPTSPVCSCDNNWEDRIGPCDDYKCEDGSWALLAPLGDECSGHGSCTEFSSTCQCDDNWAHEGLGYCNDYQCEDGVWAIAAPAECSGHGTCSPTNAVCQCENNWDDRAGYCDDYQCQDGTWVLEAPLGNECSGHGSCTEFSAVCTCQDNWNDRDGYCDDYKCEDGNWALVGGSECSGHGTCTPLSSTCGCWNNWENRIGFCDDYKCEDGLWDLGGASCSDHGGCSPTSTVCSCDNNWADRAGYCDDYQCQDGTWVLQAPLGDECSGHGSCTEFSSTCQCDDNWADRGLGYCNDYKCQDGNWAIAAPAECSGHGTCSPTNAVCQCENNWDDRAGYCDDYQCQDGTWVLEAPLGNECSGHGSCTEFSSVCSCDNNWDDRAGYCDDYKCEDGSWKLQASGSECSGHGTCSEFSSTCSCENNWNDRAGYCDDYKCEDLSWKLLASGSECSGHGTCSPTNAVCQCVDNWDDQGVGFCNDYPCEDGSWKLLSSGSECSSHGTCSPTSTVCACVDNWADESDYCDDYKCEDGNWKELSAGAECFGHGTCTPTSDICDCDNDLEYSGYLCEFPVCNTILAGEPGVCSDNGTCIAPATCSCAAADRYIGEWCDVPVCYGIGADHPNEVCNDGNGTCYAYNDCDCNRHHYGALCQNDFSCYGLEWWRPDACTSHLRGDCHSFDDNCDCFEGYIGDECEQYLCDSIPSEDPGVCTGRGDCVAPDTCDCNAYYTGQWCDTKRKCGFYEFDNPYVCFSRGDCLYSNCVCWPGYTGENCEIAECYGVASTSSDVCSSGGICFASDKCLCDSKHYGDNCEEYLPSDTVIIAGSTHDTSYVAVVPYIVSESNVPSSELPIGIAFNCTHRAVKPAYHKLVGWTTVCRWMNDGSGNTTGLNLTFPAFGGEIVDYDPVDDPELNGKVAEYLVGFAVLSNPLIEAQIELKVEIRAPLEDIVSLEKDVDPALIVGIVIPILLIILITCLLVLVMFVFAAVFRKKNQLAELKMEQKMLELQTVQDTFAHDQKKLQLALRLQKIKSVALEKLPDEYIHLEELNDDHGYVGMESAGTDDVWRRCERFRGVLLGHEVIMRRLDGKVKRVTRRAVNQLVELSTSFAAIPTHPHVRQYHAYFVGGMGAGTVKKSATGPKLLQAMTEELLVEEDGDNHVPDHGFLIQYIEREIGLIDHLFEERRKAAATLQGVTVRSGVKVEDKVSWLLQLARAILHCHYHGFTFGNLSPHAVVLDKESNVFLDLPFMTRTPDRCPFAAPEVVMKHLGMRMDAFAGYADFDLAQRSDSYSFGHIMFCVLVETKRPFRTIRDQLKGGEGVGQRAATDSEFRPPLRDPILPTWAANLLNRCWQHLPQERPSMGDLVFVLEGIATALGAECWDDYVPKEDDSSSGDDLDDELPNPRLSTFYDRRRSIFDALAMAGLTDLLVPDLGEEAKPESTTREDEPEEDARSAFLAISKAAENVEGD